MLLLSTPHAFAEPPRGKEAARPFFAKTATIDAPGGAPLPVFRAVAAACSLAMCSRCACASASFFAFATASLALFIRCPISGSHSSAGPSVMPFVARATSSMRLRAMSIGVRGAPGVVPLPFAPWPAAAYHPKLIKSAPSTSLSRSARAIDDGAPFALLLARVLERNRPHSSTRTKAKVEAERCRVAAEKARQ